MGARQRRRARRQVHKMVNRLALEYPRRASATTGPPPRATRAATARRRPATSTRRSRGSRAGIELIETRDADDLVGDRRFLREAVGQLLAHERLAFVQTVKSGEVHRGDPFDNLQPHFFGCAMASRYAANAVFPCGSGVVWRRAALSDIGDFPTWNLVEDLQSGIEALRRGWDGCYLPIVGAYAQHSPEDLPNFVKQRGTWALDTMRLMLWAPKARAEPAPAPAVLRARAVLPPGSRHARVPAHPGAGLRAARLPRGDQHRRLPAALLAVRRRPGAVHGRGPPPALARAAVARAAGVGRPQLHLRARLRAGGLRGPQRQAALRRHPQGEPARLALAAGAAPPGCCWRRSPARWAGRWPTTAS